MNNHHAWRVNQPTLFPVAMMTSSNGNISALLASCAGNSPVPSEFPHKNQLRGALMFSLICHRINGWVNTGEAGDLRLHRTHYCVIVMHFGMFMPIIIMCCHLLRPVCRFRQWLWYYFKQCCDFVKKVPGLSCSSHPLHPTFNRIGHCWVTTWPALIVCFVRAARGHIKSSAFDIPTKRA